MCSSCAIVDFHFLHQVSPRRPGQITRHLCIRDLSTFGSYINDQKLGKNHPLALLPEGAYLSLRRPKNASVLSGDFRVECDRAGADLLIDSQTSVFYSMMMCCPRENRVSG